MATAKAPEGAVSPDGQRFLTSAKGDDGQIITQDRPATLAEQAAHYAAEVGAQAQGIVTLAAAHEVEVSGQTITIKLLSADDVAKDAA